MEPSESELQILAVHTMISQTLSKQKGRDQTNKRGRCGMCRREYVETAVIFGVLLAIRGVNAVNPFPLNFDLFWYHGWYAVYVVIGFTLPVIMEKVVRRRKLSVIGFKLPTGKRESLRITAVVIVVFLVGGIINRMRLGLGLNLDLCYIASTCILLPFLEEVNFRGLMQTRLEVGLGRTKSWILSGLFFGFWHYWVHFLILWRPLTVMSLAQLGGTIVFGWVVGWIFTETKSLLPTFLLHSINNFVAVYKW